MTDVRKIPWRLPTGYEGLKFFWDEFIKKLGLDIETRVAEHAAETTDVHAASDYAQTDAAETITEAWTFEQPVEAAGLYVDGIKVAAPDANGKIVSAPYWTDLVIEGTAINPPGGASDPNRSTTTGLLEFSASQDNVITGCWQLPHGWAGEFGTANSVVVPHLHIRHLTATTLTSRWKFEYDVSSAAGNFTNAYGTFTTFSTVSSVNPNDTTKVSILSFGDLDLSATGLGASTLLHFRISRLASSDAADTDTSVIALYSMDLHYQAVQLGSESEVPSGE